jgi:hypothetical protein
VLTSGANYIVRIRGFSWHLATGAAISNAVDVSPVVAIPTGTRYVWHDLLDVVASVSGGDTHLKGRVLFHSIAIS